MGRITGEAVRHKAWLDVIAGKRRCTDGARCPRNVQLHQPSEILERMRKGTEDESE